MKVKFTNIEGVRLDITNPNKPIVEVDVPVYIGIKSDNLPLSFTIFKINGELLDTFTKHLNLNFTNLGQTRYDFSDVDRESFIDEISFKYRVKKKFVSVMRHRFTYEDKIYYYVGEIYLLMPEKYYNHWKQKYRNIQINDILN